jgi:hypothetical protein
LAELPLAALGITVENRALLDPSPKHRNARSDTNSKLNSEWCLAETTVADQQIDRWSANQVLDHEGVDRVLFD